MAGEKRPERLESHGGGREVVDYHFNITINVVSGVDEKRVRKLVDDEFAKLKAAIEGRPKK